MKRLLLPCLVAALAIQASAQTQRYSATTGEVSLSAAATAFTIQKATTASRDISLESAIVYCSVACSVTQAYNGAAATATAGTINAVPPASGQLASATVWTASNVGSGTAAGGITHVAAGTTIVLDLSKVRLNGGANANYTVSVSSITGTANITIIWSEQ